MAAYSFRQLGRQSTISSIAIPSINAYQRHLSPRKGFVCPHRTLFGEASCSEYIKQKVGRDGVLAAANAAPARFRACKAAAVQLQETRAQGGCIVIPCCIPI